MSKSTGGWRRSQLVAALLVTAVISNVASAQVTVGGGNNGGTICCFHQNSLPYFGQTFRTADAVNTRLDLFTLYEYAFNGVAAQQLSIYALDNTGNVTGGALYTSAIRIVNQDISFNTFETYNIGGLVLNSSVNYLAMFNMDVPGGTDGYIVGRYGETYAPGGLTWSGSPITTPWAPTDDIGFTAEFNIAEEHVTPEPASLVLLGTGLLGVAGVVRRRRNKAA